MKFKKTILGFFVFSLLLVSSCVSNADGGMRTLDFSGTVTSFSDGVLNLMNGIFSAESGVGDEGVAKALLFILLFVFLYAAAAKIPLLSDSDKKNSRIVVAVVIALLGIRYLTPELLVGTLLPYGALGIGISVAIPFIFYYYFVESAIPPAGVAGSAIRRLLWLFFTVVMFGLWGSRMESLGVMANIYLIFAILALLLMFFDGTIHRIGLYFKYGKEKAANVEEQLDLLKSKRDQQIVSLANTKNDTQRERIRKQIDETDKKIKSMQSLMFS